MVKSIVGLMALVSVMGMATTAKAEGYSLSVGGGATEQLQMQNADQLFKGQKFQMGETGQASLLWHFTPNLAVGPAAAVYYYQPSPNTNEGAVLWHLGGQVKLEGAHTASVSPWLSAGVGGAVQNHVGNFSLAAGMGLDFALEETHTYWLGPYAGYDHVFDTNVVQPSLLPNRDFNQVSVGIQFTFDGPVRPKVVHDVKVVVVKTPSAPVEDSKPCPVVVPATPERNPLFVVRFEKNSSALGTAQTETLDSLAAYMQAHSGKFAVVQGRASSEGPKALNLTLSKSRADAVVAYLAAHGVDAERMVASGAGGVGNPNNAANRNAIVIVLR